MAAFNFVSVTTPVCFKCAHEMNIDYDKKLGYIALIYTKWLPER